MKIIFITVAFCFLVFCANKTEIKETQDTQIRVVNSTDHSVLNVVMFSMKFGDLQPNDTTAYQILAFDPLKDDGLIYCSIDDANYSRYLEIPEEGVKNFTYNIEGIQDGIIYITSIKED